MEVDFFKDLETEIKRILKGFGCPVPSFEELKKQDKRPATVVDRDHVHYNIRNLATHFLTVVQRRIPIKKWNIHIPTKLQHRHEIQGLQTKLSNGEDVNEYLSKKVKNKNQKKTADKLLYEWRISHIHFELGGKGDDMLFVYFNDNDAYFIDILPHEKENITWTRSDLVQILHDNWPNALSAHINNNILDGKDSSQRHIITDEERRNSRQKNTVAFVIVNDGTEYTLMGGGITSSGYPFNAVKLTEKLMYDVRKLEQYAINSEQGIKEALNIKLDDKIEVRLFLDGNNNPHVYEVTQKTVLNLLPPYQEPIN